MSEHLDLFGLLRGELGNAEAIAAGDHLATCPTCQEELADAVVGHSLLTRAGSTLGPAAESSEAPVPVPLAALPQPARHRRRTVLAVAAAAVVALGAGGAVWWHSSTSGGSPSSPGSAIEAPLSPLSSAGSGHGEVQMVEDGGLTRMTIDVRDLPQATSGEFYYAWLLDPTTNKMLALGLVDPRSGSSFDVADSLVASYSAVDVSLEADDGDPAHSVTSVLRGTYEPDQITTAASSTERKS
jgi:hypothetical protein